MSEPKDTSEMNPSYDDYPNPGGPERGNVNTAEDAAQVLRLPWHRETIGHANVQEIAAQVARDLMVPLPDGIPASTDATWIVNADNKIVAFIGNGPRQTENADAIIAAVEAKIVPVDEPSQVARVVRAVVKSGWRGSHDKPLRVTTESMSYEEDGDYPHLLAAVNAILGSEPEAVDEPSQVAALREAALAFYNDTIADEQHSPLGHALWALLQDSE